MNETTLYFGVFGGALGFAYFIYGKRQQRVVPLVAGVLLCVLPYMIESPLALIGAGLACAIAPFVIKA